MTLVKETNTETQYRHELKKVCHLLYQHGLASGLSGNLSLKINSEQILITPTNCHKGLIETDDFVLVNLNGTIDLKSKDKTPSTDLQIHVETYKKRPDVNALIHAHPPTVIALTISGVELSQPVLPNVIFLLGEIPTIPYPGISRQKENELTISCLERNDAVILDKHGAVTTGKDILDAFNKMEILEYAAKIIFQALSIGEIKILNELQISEIVNERHRINGKELELREGTKLFQTTSETFKLKNLFKKLADNNSPVFQRLLSLVNEIMLLTLQKTTFSQKLTTDEKDQLARELTGSFLSMIVERFTGKKLN